MAQILSNFGDTPHGLTRVEPKHRRGQIEIFVEILTLASSVSVYGSKGVTKTHLAYESGLNFRRLERYLDLLVQRRLIESAVDEKKRKKKKEQESMLTYRTTASGERMRSILLEAEKLISDTYDGSNQYTILSLSSPEDRW
jgi:predicted transcriptional regulator